MRRISIISRNLRLLLLLNAFIFGCWCFLILSENSLPSPEEEWLSKYHALKKTEARIEKLKRSLRNHYPTENDYLRAYFVRDLPTIYAITPTYSRLTQKADLTRIAQTLLHVPNLHWIVVEDSEEKTSLVERFLKLCGLPYTHLNVKTDENYKLKANDPNWLLPRGVEQRNSGLTWIRKNVLSSTSGVVYFLDDDNTYSLKMFEEMRSTIKGSVWPVGLSGGLKFEGPALCKNGKVMSWYTAWKPQRPFPLDMAGFAVNLKLVLQYPSALFSNTVPRGYLESDFLKKVKLSREDVEAKANNCTEILVWHTRTEKPVLKQEIKLIKLGKPSNPLIEV